MLKNVNLGILLRGSRTYPWTTLDKYSPPIPISYFPEWKYHVFLERLANEHTTHQLHNLSS